jgi:hypothetical protein
MKIDLLGAIYGAVRSKRVSKSPFLIGSGAQWRVGGIEIGMIWVEERKSEDLWCGNRVRGEKDNGFFIAKSK